MMSTLKEVKEYFSIKGHKSVKNLKCDYLFVKKVNGDMFQYNAENENFKFYKTFDGFCKAVLWRLKRG